MLSLPRLDLNEIFFLSLYIPFAVLYVVRLSLYGRLKVKKMPNPPLCRRRRSLSRSEKSETKRRRKRFKKVPIPIPVILSHSIAVFLFPFALFGLIRFLNIAKKY
jgi:hypothetical protein